ncbi:HD domain-containing protein [Chlorobium phaeobacteroides]|jgi:hypothetical protein|uniref:Metal dependent phosphohydrolase n=1 Tax=Chlorobium phaeobacteroides (strain DSM 266 / SMG 266 / 2430) TaxID=290317 RepID=A1BHE9_CHLPD|nr:HD domain-containing protein [Chlorobium phaeobacteroides]ABL65826.1 metal dependent phosphohydrolase [Chlorobium phaeobacteroides DSM 266]
MVSSKEESHNIQTLITEKPLWRPLLHMEIKQHHLLIDTLFGTCRQTLGSDFEGYRNHCLRVYYFCCALTRNKPENDDKIAIAAFFHDIGIWTDDTFDYISPSQLLAREYLEKTDRTAWIPEIEAMIGEHHKLTPCKAQQFLLVEPFRKADWIDISRGMLRHRLPDDFVLDVFDAFPNEGFHKKLLLLAKARLKTHPFSPLPMMKL